MGRREDRIRRRGAHQRMSSREPAESRQVADETKAPCKQSAGNRTDVIFFFHLVVLHKTQGSRVSDILAASYVSDQQSENQSHLVSVSGSNKERETQSNKGRSFSSAVA